MRRKDREITDLSKIIEIIDRCDCCRLGLVDNGSAYIIPMNFGYEVSDDTITLYFHCASEGRKMDLIPQQSMVAFEMDTQHALVTGDIGCRFSYLYQSVMGTGTITILHVKEEKAYSLNKILEHYTGNPQSDLDDKAMDVTTVLKLSVKSLSCKAH